MKWGDWVALVTPLEPGASCPRSPAAELQSCRAANLPTTYSECRPAVYHDLLHCAALRLQGLREAVGSRIGKDHGVSAMREALAREWECVSCGCQHASKVGLEVPLQKRSDMCRPLLLPTAPSH